MARITNQDGQDPTSIARVSGTTVENATAAWHVSGGVITQIFPPEVVVAPDPRNIYSDYVNNGPVTNVQTSIVNGEPGPWVAGGGRLQFYATEIRRIPITTTTTGTQPQTRTCTAAGGCDGPFARTIRVTISVIRSTRSETRQCDATGALCSTTNPNFVEEVEESDLRRFVECSVDAESGRVTINTSSRLPRDAEGFPINFTVSLAPGQPSRYEVIPFGDSREQRNIRILVNGEVPTGFRFEGSSIPSPGIVVTCDTIQSAAAQPPLRVQARVSWTTAFGLQFRNVTGTTSRLNLDDVLLGGQYTITGTGESTSFLGTGSFSVAEALATTTHTIIGSDATRTASITFDVTARRPSGGGPGEPEQPQ